MEGRRRAGFRQATNTQEGGANPRELFRDLPRDENVPFLWGHQERILEAYEEQSDAPDLALELPTGTGKTLIGLLIGEWRRRARSERILYLCPTRQLAHQVGTMARIYGIETKVCLAPGYEGLEEWQNGDAIAISTYSSLFNFNPRFTEPRTLILDDAHAADGYVASHWTVTIDREDMPDTYGRIASLLRPSVGHRTSAMMLNDEPRSLDRSGVELVPLPQWWPYAETFEEILDRDLDGSDQWFSWAHHVREGLAGCCLLVSWKEIVLRPAIPTTRNQRQFADAAQRVYMSATLGSGGELERIFGIRRIERLPVPDEWERRSTGRRLFLFPSASLGAAEVEDLIADAIEASDRAVVLTPTQSGAEERRRTLGEAGVPTVGAGEIEENLEAFTDEERAALVLANRYDGIDLPGDACRLLVIDGLPVAVNILEKFLYQRLTATNLLTERVRTRLTQGAGRCTRGEGDWSAVLVLTNVAYDFCARPAVLPLLHPELQGELRFGLDESRDRSAEEFLDLIEILREHGEEWGEAEGRIRELREQATRGDDPAADQLERVVAREVDYTYAMRESDFPRALEHAVAVADGLGGAAAAAYRSWWLYQAGAAAWMANHAFEMPEMVERARDLFRRAMASGPALPWFAELAYGDLGEVTELEHDPGDLRAVERVHDRLSAAGFHGQGFSRLTGELESRLAGGDAAQWEQGVTELGCLMGFDAHLPDGSNVPDSVWIATDELAFVWELKSEENPAGEIGARSVQQVNGHVSWVRENCDLTEGAEIVPLLLSDRTRLGAGAEVHVGEVALVGLDQVRQLAAETISILARVRAIGGDGDVALVRQKLLEELASSGKLPSQLAQSLAARSLGSLPSP